MPKDKIHVTDIAGLTLLLCEETTAAILVNGEAFEKVMSELMSPNCQELAQENNKLVAKIQSLKFENKQLRERILKEHNKVTNLIKARSKEIKCQH